MAGFGIPPAVQRMMDERTRRQRRLDVTPGLETSAPGEPFIRGAAKTLGEFGTAMGEGVEGLLTPNIERANVPESLRELQALREANTARIEAAAPPPTLAQASPGRKMELRDELQQMRQAQLQRAGEPSPPPPWPPGPTEPPGGPVGPDLGPGTRIQPLGPMPGSQAPARPPGREVWEQEATREGDLGKLGMAREISEGLKLAGRSMVGLSGARIPGGDDTAGDIREAIAKREDEVSPQMRQMLESKGLTIPEGISHSKLVEMGVIPQHFAEQRATAGRESREAISARGIGERAGRETTRQQERTEDIARKEKERTEGLAVAEKKFGKMSDKELAEVSQIDDALQGMRSILKEREEKDYSTGFLDKMAVKGAEFIGVGLSPENLQWRGKVRLQLATWIRDMAGAALGPKEAELYLDAMPTEWDNEPAFDAKLTSVIDGLEKKRQGFLETRRWAGKTTEPFDLTSYTVPGKGKANVPGGDREAFEAKYPTAVRGAGHGR